MGKDRFLSFRGVTVRFRLERPDRVCRGRALLIPAPGLAAEQYDRVLPELLDAGLLCVVCDLPGFGRSACFGGVPHANGVRSQILWGVLDDVDALHGGRLMCWHLIAHGSACLTACEMARSQQASISSMTLICPSLFRSVPPALRKAVGMRPGRAAAGWLYDRFTVRRKRFYRLARFVYGRDVPGEEWSPLRRSLVRPGARESFVELLREGREDVPAGGLFVPKMVLWGGSDGVLGGSIPPKLRAAMPDAEFHVIRGAGHVPMYTHPKPVRDYLRGWIRTNC